MIGFQTNDHFAVKCAGCGAELGEDNQLWQAAHLGTMSPSEPYNSSANSASGAVFVWHCSECDPNEVRIAFLREELEKLEAGQYTGGGNSDEWKFVNGL